MTQEQWTAVDRYFEELFVPGDPALDGALRAADEAGLPSIHVSAGQGRLLAILAGAVGARAILEIGTLAGYSTIWLARALPPGGRLVTLEANPAYAELARANLWRAGVAEAVEVRVGRALDTLALLAAEGGGPFDLVFIDADKPNYAAYFDWALRLARPGSLIVADNIVRRGSVVDADSDDERVQGVRQFNERVAAEPRVSAAGVQTVGSKGYDGFVIAIVKGRPEFESWGA